MSEAMNLADRVSILETSLSEKSARVEELEAKVCKNCTGQRWVCENHSNKSWNEGEPGCCGGAGMPCPECNPANWKAKVADWNESVRTIMETSCRADEKHCTCVPLLRAKVDEINENYEDMITHRLELESTVARLKEEKKNVIETLEFLIAETDSDTLKENADPISMNSVNRVCVETYKMLTAPSPSANSGEKPS